VPLLSATEAGSRCRLCRSGDNRAQKSRVTGSFAASAYIQVIALDAATGDLLWRYKTHVGSDYALIVANRNRVLRLT